MLYFNRKPVTRVLSWRLAVVRGPPGGSKITRGSRGLGRLAAGAVPLGSTYSEKDFEALYAWQYATPVRRSRSWQRLAACVPRQAICTAAAWNFECICVIYKASSDTLKVGLLGSLSCGSEHIP